jgi:hypothetical protein
MAKKDKPETTLAPLGMIDDAMAALLPDNSSGLFEGMELQDAIHMEEGMEFKAMFIGRGPDMEFENADGQGVDIVATWKFKFGSTVIPIRGAAGLDRQMMNVLKTYKLPCPVAVAKKGQRELKSGRRMHVYIVAGDGEKVPPGSEPSEPVFTP